MATTSPDNIWSPDSGDDYALTVDLAAMADTVQDAITANRGYRVGTDTERLALSGAELFEGLKFWVTGTRVEWLYTNGAWVVQDTGWVPVTVFGASWGAQSGYGVQVRRIGSRVDLRGAVTGGGSVSNVLTVPAGFRPATNTFLPQVHSNAAFNGSALMQSSGTLSFPAGYFDGSLTVSATVPLVGPWFVD